MVEPIQLYGHVNSMETQWFVIYLSLSLIPRIETTNDFLYQCMKSKDYHSSACSAIDFLPATSVRSKHGQICQLTVWCEGEGIIWRKWSVDRCVMMCCWKNSFCYTFTDNHIWLLHLPSFHFRSFIKLKNEVSRRSSDISFTQSGENWLCVGE